MSTTKSVNNLGTFYTNLGKTATNVKNSLKNAIQNSPKTINSMMPALPNTSSGVSYFSGLNPTYASNSGKSSRDWVWPLLIFITITFICIVIIVRYKDQISAGLENIGQMIRNYFNKPSSTLKDASVPPPTPVTDIPVPPQNETNQNKNDIIDKLIPNGGKHEVFNVSKNEFTYYDSEPLCRALGAELATYEQVKEAWSQGADWCNYGWVKGQAAVYPTQEETWKRVQSGPEENRGSCGMPGLNGGYFDNPEMKFGVNCFGVKPVQSEHDQEQLMKQGRIPMTVPSLEVDKKVQQFREEADSMGLLPFNDDKWYS